MPARKSSAAVRLATEQGIATAPTAQKPIPVGVDWPSIVNRGYHVLWGRMYNWNMQSFFTITMKHHFEQVLGRDFHELLNSDVFEEVPVQFVKDAPANGSELFTPITTVEDLKVGITNLRRDHSDYDPYQPRNTDAADASLHVGRDEWYKPELFANATAQFPVEYALAYHITRRRFVGFASWAFNRIADDRSVAADKPTLAKPAKKSAFGYKSKSKTSTAKKSTGSIVIDTKGLLVFGDRMNATRRKEFQGEINTYRSHNLDGWATGATTLVFNNVKLAGDELAADALNLVIDEEGNFSGYWKGKLSQKGYVFSTGVLASVEHFMRIRKSMTEDDYARAWMKRFMEKGAKEVTELEKKQLKLQQEALGVSKQLGDARFMQELMREGGFAAFKSKLRALTTVPGVESVNFLPDGIALTTEEITMFDPKDKASRFIGRFYIVLDLMGNKVTIQNLMQTKTGKVHPFVGEGGGFCLGSYSGILGQALATSDYEILAMTMLELLRDVQGLTYTGRNMLSAWAKERPDTFAPGRVVTLYQGYGVTAIAGGSGDYEDEDEWDD